MSIKFLWSNLRSFSLIVHIFTDIKFWNSPLKVFLSPSVSRHSPVTFPLIKHSPRPYLHPGELLHHKLDLESSIHNKPRIFYSTLLFYVCQDKDKTVESNVCVLPWLRRDSSKLRRNGICYDILFNEVSSHWSLLLVYNNEFPDV